MGTKCGQGPSQGPYDFQASFVNRRRVAAHLVNLESLPTSSGPLPVRSSLLGSSGHLSSPFLMVLGHELRCAISLTPWARLKRHVLCHSFISTYQSRFCLGGRHSPSLFPFPLHTPAVPLREFFLSLNYERAKAKYLPLERALMKGPRAKYLPLLI